MKLSIVVPVYEDGMILETLYQDLYRKVFSKADFEYELIFVNDGSGDNTLELMMKLKEKDAHIKVHSLSRNFGSHAAVLCGISVSAGDCVCIKNADLQEPSELIFDMVQKWREGNNVVLAVRQQREESRQQIFFANFYYKLVRKFVNANMPKNGFDIFLLDRKAADVLLKLDERNSSIGMQILWSGFKTAYVPYIRSERREGVSKWTLRKKMRLVMDTFFSFSTVPVKGVSGMGCLFAGCGGSAELLLLFRKMCTGHGISYRRHMFFFCMFCCGLILIADGILGEYLWRVLDASRNRPVYVQEEIDRNGRD